MARRALVLAGGGGRGAFEAGVCWNLIIERGLWFDVVTGVSIGAINGALLAQAFNLSHSKRLVAEMRETWFGLRDANDIFRPWYPIVPAWLNVALTVLFKKPSIYSLQPTRELLEKHIDDRKLRRSPIKFAWGYVDANTGAYRRAGKDFGGPIIDAVLASSAIPAVFPPVELPGGELGIDGGVRETTPLGDAFDILREWPAGDVPDEIWVVIPSTPFIFGSEDVVDLKVAGWTKILVAAFSAITNEIHLNDVEHALEINELVKLGTADPKYRYAEIKLVYAGHSLGSALDFTPGVILDRFDHGMVRAGMFE